MLFVCIMAKFESFESEDESDGDDAELQEAFAAGLLKPGLNVVAGAPKQFINNVKAIKQKQTELALNIPWLETLAVVNSQAPLAPELAVKLMNEENKMENMRKNNKKLPQIPIAEDPVLNDFKREMMFHRQAQGAVLEAIPKLKVLSIPTIRPDDYFAEMAKSDDHMTKIRQNLMRTQKQHQMSERVKQLRLQKKEGKALQIQTKLERQKEKQDMLKQMKNVKKGRATDLKFLDNKPKGISRKSIEKRKKKDKKFGFGGKKSGTKGNTKDSAADITEYRRPKQLLKQKRGNKDNNNKRLGKNRRQRTKNKKH